MEQAVAPGHSATHVAAPQSPDPRADGRKTEEKPEYRDQY